MKTFKAKITKLLAVACLVGLAGPSFAVEMLDEEAPPGNTVFMTGSGLFSQCWMTDGATHKTYLMWAGFGSDLACAYWKGANWLANAL